MIVNLMFYFGVYFVVTTFFFSLCPGFPPHEDTHACSQRVLCSEHRLSWLRQQRCLFPGPPYEQDGEQMPVCGGGGRGCAHQPFSAFLPPLSCSNIHIEEYLVNFITFSSFLSPNQLQCHAQLYLYDSTIIKFFLPFSQCISFCKFKLLHKVISHKYLSLKF